MPAAKLTRLVCGTKPLACTWAVAGTSNLTPLADAVKALALAPVSCKLRSATLTSTLLTFPMAPSAASFTRSPASTEVQSAVIPPWPTSTEYTDVFRVTR